MTQLSTTTQFMKKNSNWQTLRSGLRWKGGVSWQIPRKVQIAQPKNGEAISNFEQFQPKIRS